MAVTTGIGVVVQFGCPRQIDTFQAMVVAPSISFAIIRPAVGMVYMHVGVASGLTEGLGVVRVRRQALPI